ncbi:hypothetical protein L596_018464 [Steinernema carpocapsae]|uniref:Uncharacterized protein n=1 Tax=Steinernema carpocapsae TaxID=34508 RepID=A0A4U5N5I8_STECR|nr:hypothetical protein L596_018464 [Steinernema carpocapsae]
MIEVLLTLMFLWVCYCIDYERKRAGQRGIPVMAEMFDALTAYFNLQPPVPEFSERHRKRRSTSRKSTSRKHSRSHRRRRSASSKKHRPSGSDKKATTPESGTSTSDDKRSDSLKEGMTQPGSITALPTATADPNKPSSEEASSRSLVSFERGTTESNNDSDQA